MSVGLLALLAGAVLIPLLLAIWVPRRRGLERTVYKQIVVRDPDWPTWDWPKR